MSKAVDKFFEQLKGSEKVGAVEAAKEGVLAIAPGLGNFWSDLGHELKHQVQAGAHEAAALLFTGSGFVMYPRGSHDQAEIVPPATPEQGPPELERDGR